MKRTDADGSVSGLFSNGNPGTGDPATVVEETWLNSIQEEVCNVIEGAGIVLDDMDDTQLAQAIGIATQSGALWANLAIANNQVVAANLAGLLFDKTKEYAARILYHLHRHTDTGGSEVVATGEIFARYLPVADTWDLSEQSQGDEHGAVFSITSAGQLQYTSSSIAGANYVGEMRVSDVKKIRKA